MSTPLSEIEDKDGTAGRKNSKRERDVEGLEKNFSKEISSKVIISGERTKEDKGETSAGRLKPLCIGVL